MASLLKKEHLELRRRVKIFSISLYIVLTGLARSQKDQRKESKYSYNFDVLPPSSVIVADEGDVKLPKDSKAKFLGFRPKKPFFLCDPGMGMTAHFSSKGK